MIEKEQWIALRPKRAAITAALQAIGVPIVAWCNDQPEIKAGYKPDWAEIEKVALGVTDIKPKPKAAVKKPPAKKAKTK
jgi:hypothetical protein